MNNKISKIRLKPILIPEQVSQVLTQVIIEGVLKGGDRLVEDELQEQLGVSRSPIREAFRDLASKGLVEIVPRKGTFVKTVARKDIDQFFPVLAVLEGLAAEEAVNKLTDDNVKEMEKTLDNMRIECRKGNATAFRELHNSFHHIYIYAADNTLLENILRNLRMHIMWYRFSFKYHQEDLNHSLQVHKHILELFKQGLPKEVGKAVRGHVMVAHQKFLEYLNNVENNGGL